MKKYINLLLIPFGAIIILCFITIIESDISLIQNNYNNSDIEQTVKDTSSLFKVQNQGTLVYKKYESDTFYVDNACTIRLENIQKLLSSKKVVGIILYNYDEKLEKDFPADTNTIEYKIEEKGTYCIYALIEDGEFVSLCNYISFEYECDTNCIVENEIINL